MTISELEQEIAGLKERITNLEEGGSLSYRQKLRLDNALQNTKSYYVVPSATGPTGPSTIKLTFKDGVLSSET